MKRFITNDDLTFWDERAATLRKLTTVAQKIHADLAVEEGYMKAAEQSIRRCHGRLHNDNRNPKKRSRLEQQLELHQQISECASLEYDRKNSGYSEVISEIEDVLRDLAAIYVESSH
jgi:hypothetical protein